MLGIKLGAAGTRSKYAKHCAMLPPVFLRACQLPGRWTIVKVTVCVTSSLVSTGFSGPLGFVHFGQWSEIPVVKSFLLCRLVWVQDLSGAKLFLFLFLVSRWLGIFLWSPFGDVTRFVTEQKDLCWLSIRQIISRKSILNWIYLCPVLALVERSGEFPGSIPITAKILLSECNHPRISK